MQIFKTYIQKNIVAISALVILSAIAFHEWFTFNIFFSGDWYFEFSRNVQTLKAAGIWDANDTGAINLLISRYPIDLLANIIATMFAVNSNVVDVFVFYLPVIVVTPIAGYLIGKQVFKTNLAGFIAGLIFSFNSYFLAITTQGHILINIAAAFCTLSLYYVVKILNEESVHKLRDALLASLFVFAASAYDFRIVYIYAFIFIGYALIKINKHNTVDFLKYIGVIVTATIALSLYWILPIVKSSSLADNDILNRALFGSEYWTLASAITLHHPFWTGSATDWFHLQGIPAFAYLIPIAAILGLYVYRKNKVVLYFGVVTIIGILLSKQESEPFTQLYSWLYAHFPGFSAFREATKFYILIALGYSILIAGFVQYGARKKWRVKNLRLGYIPAIIVSALFIINVIPYVDGSVKGLTAPRTIPTDYTVLQKATQADNENYRTAWLPSVPIWSYQDLNHPKLNMMSLLSGKLPYLVGDKDDTLWNEEFKNFFKNPVAQQIISNANVKYVAVAIRDPENENDFFKYYGDSRQDYIDMLNKVGWLKRVDVGTKDVAVYENSTYKPYVFSSDNLVGIDNPAALQMQYKFIGTTLGLTDFNYALLNDLVNSPTPRTEVSDVGHSLTKKDLVDEKIVVANSKPATAESTLYFDRSKVQYGFKRSDTQLNFYQQIDANVAVDGNKLINQGEQPLSSIKLDAAKTYYLSIDNELFKLSDQDETRTIGSISNELSVAASDNASLVKNGSFEEGTWQNTVQDCNNYDDTPAIAMTVSEAEQYDGRKSLELDSTKHTACTTSEAVPVVAGQSYGLSYFFKFINGQKAGYELTFNDAKHTKVSDTQVSDAGAWHEYSRAFTAPIGATSVKITLMGYSDNQRKKLAQTYYDNVRIINFDTVETIAKAKAPDFAKIELPKGKTAVLSNDSYKQENLIANPSLEKGMWQKSVGDCNNYDNNAMIGMTANKATKTDGLASLSLYAERHDACTGPEDVSVDEGSSYLFSFDYQSDNAKQAGYYIRFNDQKNTVLTERVDIKNKDWNTFTKTVNVPYGATKATLIVYSYQDAYGLTKIINNYDNFDLTKVPNLNDRVYLVSASSKKLQSPQAITFDRQSPSTTKISVTSAATAFYVNLSESYHPDWKIQLDSKGAAPVAESSHINTIGSLNSWYIDPAVMCSKATSACSKNQDGSYNIKLIAHFAPQDTFKLGVVISGVTLAMIILGIGGLSFIGKRPKNKHRIKLGGGRLQ